MNTSNKIVPVILAGGSGTRLWPQSRKNLPKQFARINHQPSLFQQTVQRTCDRSLFGAPIIVASLAHHSIVLTQLAAIGVDDAAIILETEGRDTAAAIALAVELHPHEDSLMLVLPSDHHVGAPALMEEAVLEAAAVARSQGAILTFGIKPSRPETGYGYLRCGGRIGDTNAYALESFIEKPDAETANRLCLEPAVLWNAGIFLFERAVMRREFETLMPQFNKCLTRSVRLGSFDRGAFVPHPVEFARVEKVSVDYAIMEKTSHAAVMPVDPQWSDMGSWNSVWEIGDKDDRSNCLGDNVFSHDCSGSLAISDGPAIGIAGLKDIVVVANRDAVLVTSRTDPQGVKHVVAQMADAGHAAVVSHPGETRPWGSFASIDRGSMHQVKRIEVVPGGRLSLQYHFHRAEHWVVVSGMATVTVDETVMELGPCQQVFIPKGAVHRLENRTSEPVQIIEVQYGDYLGEDDIVRVEDVYGRECEPAPMKTAA